MGHPQPKPQLDTSITDWWSQIIPNTRINDDDRVREKQKNAIEFADYCRNLLKACELVYFSEIEREINIKEIQGSE